MWLPAPPGRARSIYLERSGANYTDREVALLSLLRPQLIRARQAAERRRAAAPPLLTPREAEVLAWIGAGKTNREISQLLFISPFTVRQHVENIFQKLGVQTRAAAVAALTGLGGGDRREVASPRVPIADFGTPPSPGSPDQS
ncbi:MAG TPA: helix-turn-helix transcriptional regulator [Gammaproteobacteria bacterium]|nr:helix-turn-helix transcriptional regulator [Gammaproteobacteria bacterium]